jgi:hypothetical protein
MSWDQEPAGTKRAQKRRDKTKGAAQAAKPMPPPVPFTPERLYYTS